MKRGLVPIAWIFCAAGCGAATRLVPADASDDAAASVNDTMVDGTDRRAAEAGATVDGGIADGTYQGDAEVSGTVGGQLFSSHGAIGLVLDTPASDPFFPRSVTVTIPANFDVTCTQLYQASLTNTARPNGAVLQINLSAGGIKLVPGTYIAMGSSPNNPVAGTLSAIGGFITTDADCSNRFDWFSGGSVTVTAVDSMAIWGTFELSFASGDQLAGQFSAPLCHTSTPAGGGAIMRPPATCLD